MKVRSDPSKLPLYLQVYKETMDAAFSAGAAGVLFWSWGVGGTRNLDVWWAGEDHSVEDDPEFARTIREYKMPEAKTFP